MKVFEGVFCVMNNNYVKNRLEDNRIISFLLSQVDVLQKVQFYSFDNFTLQDIFLGTGEIIEKSGTFQGRDLRIVTEHTTITFPTFIEGLQEFLRSLEKRFYIGDVRFTGPNHDGENPMWIEGIHWNQFDNVLGLETDGMKIENLLVWHKDRRVNMDGDRSRYMKREYRLKEFAEYVTMDSDSRMQLKRISRVQDPHLKFYPPKFMVEYLREGGFYDDADEFLDAYRKRVHSEDSVCRDCFGEYLHDVMNRRIYERSMRNLPRHWFEEEERTSTIRRHRYEQARRRHFLSAENSYFPSREQSQEDAQRPISEETLHRVYMRRNHEWTFLGEGIMSPSMNLSLDIPIISWGRSRHVPLTEMYQNHRARVELVHEYILSHPKYRFLIEAFASQYSTFLWYISFLPQHLDRIARHLFNALPRGVSHLDPRRRAIILETLQELEELLDNL